MQTPILLICRAMADRGEAIPEPQARELLEHAQAQERVIRYLAKSLEESRGVRFVWGRLRVGSAQPPDGGGASK